MSTGPREKVYDEQISPLMTKIIAICQEHKIPMVASFELDRTEGHAENDPLFCTTALLPKHWEIYGTMLPKMLEIVRAKPASFAAFAITTADKKDLS